MLDSVFRSSARKVAFSGHFDEEGLIYPGWVSEIAHRDGDGLLALVALGNGTYDSMRLEKAVVDILRRPQYWNGVDKNGMRDVPLEICGRNAVGDACHTFELVRVLEERLARAEYLSYLV